MGRTVGARRLQPSVVGRARAGERVAALTVDLLRRERRRLLHERAAERVERRLDRLARRHGRVADWSNSASLRIGGIGREPQADDGVVGLVACGQECRESRRLAEDEQQDAGRHRIERAGVADPFLAQHAAHARHHVVRRRALRLVNDEQAVHRSRP